MLAVDFFTSRRSRYSSCTGSSSSSSAVGASTWPAAPPNRPEPGLPSTRASSPGTNQALRRKPLPI